MRIIAGLRRGLVLKDFDAEEIRPTRDQVRESIFNILANLIFFPDADVCDLFAGSGALGIEALSRGARRTTFVEWNPTAIRLIHDNLTKARMTESASVVQADVLAWLQAAPAESFDVILADPPYGLAAGDFIIEKVWANGYLKPLGVLVLETGPDEVLHAPDSLRLHRKRTWGQSVITIFRKDDA